MAEEFVKTLKLNRPVILNNTEITELKFKRLKAKDLRNIDLANLKMDDFLLIAGRLTNQTSAVIDEIDFEDVHALIEMIADFLSNTR